MFSPTVNSRIAINGQEFTFAPHPVVPSITWGQEGRRAIVFRLNPTTPGSRAYALKVFRPVFRHDGLLEAASALETYHELPGMDVCQQIVLTERTHPQIVKQYPDLNYAMLMPWIDGKTWFDILNEETALTLDRSRALAESMSWVLYALEYNRIAHCDLSSGNVIVEPNGIDIQLIDVEDLYSPHLTPPPFVPVGTMGYQHQAVPQAPTGQWGPRGDRFAGAVLMAEMLAWAHPEIRQRAHGESYFAPDELQQQSERYDLLIDVLRMYNPGFSEAFEQAWRSTTLEECPPIELWYTLFDDLPREPVREWAPIDPDVFKEPEPTPPAYAAAAAADRGPTQAPQWQSARQPTQQQPAQQQSPAQRRQGCQVAIVLTGLFLFLCCYGTVVLIQLENLGVLGQ